MADDAATIEQLRAALRRLQDLYAACRTDLATMIEEKRDALAEQAESHERALAEALEQQTATAEVLRVIAASPTNLQPVLAAVLNAACRLCGASGGILHRLEGDWLPALATANFSPEATAYALEHAIPVGRGSVAGRTAQEGRVVHVEDVLSDPDYELTTMQQLTGYRSLLGVPLMREGRLIGVMVLTRSLLNVVRPFATRQIALAETFADQAVIAIENARLFEELEQRNRELSEALEQQTATAEVLRVIASAPTDLDRVLQAIVETAARLCEAPSGALLEHREESHRLVPRAVFGRSSVIAERDPSVFQQSPGSPAIRTSAVGHAFVERRTVHVLDMAAAVQSEYPDSRRIQALIGSRTVVYVPLLRQGTPIGVLSLQRQEVRPYSEQQIRLVESFADQAVIAIENARLFQELEQRNRDLREALEQQTATGDILRVIASSPTDLQAVLHAITESAARLCGTEMALLFRVEGDAMRVAATYGTPVPGLERGTLAPLDRSSGTGRALLDRRAIYVEDAAALPEDDFSTTRAFQQAGGYRTYLATPLMREGVPIGTLNVARMEMRPLTDKQIALVKTFADQAVIAIENARLFEELQGRVTELQALGEVSRAVSSSLDLERVLDTVVTRANELAGTDSGAIFEYDEASAEFHLRATQMFDTDLESTLQADPPRLGEGAVGLAAATQVPVQIADLLVEGAYRGHLRDALAQAGHRALLAVPLLIEDRVLGGLVVARKMPGEFPPATIALLETFAGQSALAIQNARLFQEIEEKGRELEVASRHKSAFLANMSHELRTPLNAIIGYSEMLQEEAEEVGEQTFLPDLQRINGAGKHLLGLINDILDLSKIEAGRMDLFVESFAVAQLVRDVQAIVQPLVEKNGNMLVVSCPDEIGIIQADQTKVRQTLFNLLSNAAKFTSGGSIELRVAREAPTPQPLRGANIGCADVPPPAAGRGSSVPFSPLPRKGEGSGVGATSPSRSPTPGSG